VRDYYSTFSWAVGQSYLVKGAVRSALGGWMVYGSAHVELLDPADI